MAAFTLTEEQAADRSARIEGLFDAFIAQLEDRPHLRPSDKIATALGEIIATAVSKASLRLVGLPDVHSLDAILTVVTVTGKETGDFIAAMPPACWSHMASEAVQALAEPIAKARAR